jgi:hypothetical protein
MVSAIVSAGLAQMACLGSHSWAIARVSVDTHLKSLLTLPKDYSWNCVRNKPGLNSSC